MARAVPVGHDGRMAETPEPPDPPEQLQRYLERAPDAGRTAYLALRDIVLRQAPTATETLSYSMPTFLVDGRLLLHASAWKEHFAIYPLPGDAALTEELEPYTSGASTLKLLYRNGFPTELVEHVVAAHVARLAAERA